MDFSALSPRFWTSTTNIATSGLRSIRERWRRLLQTFEPDPVEVLTVDIDGCRHYAGYRYGAAAFNPYENYVVGLHRGTDRCMLRAQFEGVLRHFRPRTFGQLLGVALPERIPLWLYPWADPSTVHWAGGWWANPRDVTDIMTQFSAKGIRRSHVEREFVWLENAYDTISRDGYQPRAHSFIDVFEMRHGSHRAFVVKDGNHRLSAMAATGESQVEVTRDTREVYDTRDAPAWSQVKAGVYTVGEAVALVCAYIAGVNGFTSSSEPADILEGE